MAWFLAFVLFAILVVVAWNYGRFRRHWRRLESIIDDLAEGRDPQTFLFLKGGRFAKLSGRLERIGELQERQQIRRSRHEMNLQTILGAMEEGVVVVDRQHVVKLANPPLLRLFNLTADPTGQRVLENFRSAGLDELVSLALSTWQPQAREISIGVEKTPRLFAVSAMPMRNATGEEGVVAIVRDVTRLRQLEDMRREFVANVSHELRTPLSIFHGYLENLRDNPDLPRKELVEIIGVLEKHSLRLNALVEDLLILARLESRDLHLQLEEIDLGPFLREIVADWKLRSSRKEITLTLEIARDLPPIHADVLRIEQVMNNLIDNAIKYTPSGGAVTVRAGAGGDHVELRIEDNGVGIEPRDLPHIFERFYRADKARSREQGGTGLGLSIVKHIAQTHGGTVTAESTYGIGTTIILRLPLRAPETVLSNGGM